MSPRGPDVPRGAVTAADGLVVVDKPPGLTSHDVVARMRRLAATKKVGHAGTLDPMATGVLVLGAGRATRLLTYLVGADKEYTATIRLGQRTLTDDAEGEVSHSPGAAHLVPAETGPHTAPTAAEGADPPTENGRIRTLAEIEGAMAALRGSIEQVPSAVSAIKVDGKRSYARVRDGEDVALEARPVRIHRFELTAAPRPRRVPAGGAGGETPVLDLDVVVRCSSGTYVRALARDLGTALGTGGHLTALRRTRVGPFTLDHARTLEELAAAVREDSQGETPAGLPVLSLTDAATALFGLRRLDEREAAAVRYGKPLPASDPRPDGDAAEVPGPGPVVAALAPDGHVVALLRDELRHGALKARPVLVLDPA